MQEKFQIFGSENSNDYDVVVFVDSISKTIDVAHDECKKFNEQLSLILTDKVINSNMAVIQDGIVVDVFKGTNCELTNALFYTYHLHKQFHPLQITHTVERNMHEKIIRVARGILSFYSRSEFRAEIKPALKGDLILKRAVLEKIDLSIYYDFRGKKERQIDIKKIIAFQYAQLFSLIDGFEKDSYTKNGCAKNYPDLAPFLNREESDIIVLEKYKQRLLKTIDENIPLMKTLFELKQNGN